MSEPNHKGVESEQPVSTERGCDAPFEVESEGSIIIGPDGTMTFEGIYAEEDDEDAK